MTELKIGTYNVRGLTDHSKWRKMFYYLNKKEFDIIFLQETHSSKANERIWRAEYGGRAIFSHGTGNARGVAILFKKKTGIKITYQKIDEEGRMILLQVLLNGEKFNLVNIYGPNVDNSKFFKEVFETISKTGISNTIIGGDWNVCYEQ